MNIKEICKNISQTKLHGVECCPDISMCDVAHTCASVEWNNFAHVIDVMRHVFGHSSVITL